jgi:hypothetical protein
MMSRNGRNETRPEPEKNEGGAARSNVVNTQSFLGGDEEKRPAPRHLHQRYFEERPRAKREILCLTGFEQRLLLPSGG